jgi:uncharacterized protein
MSPDDSDDRHDSGSERDGPRWSLGSTMGWTLVVAVAYVIAQLFGLMMAGGAAALRAGSTSGGGAGAGVGEGASKVISFSGNMLAMATVTATLVCVPLIVWILQSKPQADLRRDLALRPVSRPMWWYWLGAAVVFALLSDGLAMLFGRPLVDPAMRSIYQSAEPAWLLVLAIVIAAPLLEEVFFRGFLYRGIAMTRAATIGAIVITAALWSWLHVQYDAYGMFNVFVMGLLLGTARKRSGSVLVPIAMHALNNAIATVQLAMAA